MLFGATPLQKPPNSNVIETKTETVKVRVEQCNLPEKKRSRLMVFCRFQSFIQPTFTTTHGTAQDALMSGNVRIIRILRVTRVIRVVRVVKIVRFIRALRSIDSGIPEGMEVSVEKNPTNRWGEKSIGAIPETS